MGAQITEKNQSVGLTDKSGEKINPAQEDGNLSLILAQLHAAPVSHKILDAVNKLLRKTRMPDETLLGYNAVNNLIRIRKDINGKTYERVIDDPNVTDKVVSRWVKYIGWVEV